MDREKTIELGNQVYNITPFNINSQLRMLEEFLLKKKVVITELFYYIKRNNYE